MRVRAARRDDLVSIAAIHNRAIVDTTISWLWEPIDVPERELWLAEQEAANRPVLVADIDGRVAGFAYYAPFRAYAGYCETVENSVYIDTEFHHRGVGRALMEALMATAKERGKHVMVAAIALPNDASVGLHRALGFMEVGTMPEVGLKFDSRLDLLLMQKIL